MKIGEFGNCLQCHAPLYEKPKNNHRCPNSCDIPDLIGVFEFQGYNVYFSYRKRIIVETQEIATGKFHRVIRGLFNVMLNELKRRCGEERRFQTGPFWGLGGLCGPDDFKEEDYG